jgi:C4-dicarboxylate-specific signal transduction histidine kinase
MNITIVGRDLTDEKRSEAKLRDFNAALEKRVIERTAEVMEAKRKLEIEQAERWRLDARLQELQSELFRAARLSATGQMAGALAHELSQPLAAVAIYSPRTKPRRIHGPKSCPRRWPAGRPHSG